MILQEPAAPLGNVKIAITLLLTFAIGANLSSAIHEFGHALGCWLGGGQVTGFVLRPFDFSYVSMNMGVTPPWSHMLASGGGILFGVLFALPLLPLLRLLVSGSVSWLIVLMTATLAFGLNGVLLMQSVATGAGDPQEALIYGNLGYQIPSVVMRILFALFAIPILVIFGRLTLKLLRSFGPAKDDSYIRWVATVEAGFMTYFILMTGHTAIFGDRAMLMRQMLRFYIPFMLLLALLILAAATWVYRTAARVRFEAAGNRQLTNSRLFVLFGIACAIIGAELCFLGPR